MILFGGPRGQVAVSRRDGAWRPFRWSDEGVACGAVTKTARRCGRWASAARRVPGGFVYACWQHGGDV